MLAVKLFMLIHLLYNYVVASSADVTIHEYGDIIYPNCSTSDPQITIDLSRSSASIFNCSFDGGKDMDWSLRFGLHLPNPTPVLLSIEQKNEIFSANLPIKKDQIDSVAFTSIEEQLCPIPTRENIRFRIATSSDANLTLHFSVKHVAFQLQDGGPPVALTVTPVSPWVKMLTWAQGADNVLVTVQSNNDVCAMMVLRNAKCPVPGGWQNMADIDARYQTFTTKGSLIATRTQFPDGIFVVTWSLPTDDLCTSNHGHVFNVTSRHKTINLAVQRHGTIKDAMVVFWISAIVTTILILFITALAYQLMQRNFMTIMNLRDESLADVLERARTSSNQQLEASGGFDPQPMDVEDLDPVDTSQNDQRELVFAQNNVAVPNAYNQLVGQGQFDLPPEASEMTEAFNPRFMVWWNMVENYKRKLPSTQIGNVGFHKNLCLVGALVLEPMIDIIQSFMSNGYGQESCLFNERCAVSAGSVRDFTPVFTSAIYCLCGSAFALLASQHQRHTAAIKYHFEPSVVVGVSHNYSIFSSLGYGLFLQGIMSGLYHVCPNRTTLHFDMMFMYIIAVLFAVAVYGLRHRDVSQRTYTTFGLVIASLFLAKWQHQLPYSLFWSLMSGGHVLLTASTTMMLCKLGTWTWNPLHVRHLWKGWSPIMSFMQNHNGIDILRVIRTVIGVCPNVFLAIIGPLLHMDPYMYILLICIVNLLTYSLHYVGTKLLYKEIGRGTKTALSFYLASILCWIPSLILFTYRTTDSLGTPAESNALNEVCAVFGVYSYHDIWHLFSALSLFFTFIAFLLIDDDLVATNSKKIRVF